MNGSDKAFSRGDIGVQLRDTLKDLKLSVSNVSLFKNLRGGVLISLGYMLSPLSWWNDLFFNVPIALVFGYGVSWINSQWFIPGTIMGYWLSNVLGMVMMQFGAVNLFLPNDKQNTTRDIWIGFGGATLYTIIAAALVYYHILDIPDFLTDLQR